MAQSTELSRHQIITRDGLVTATVVDRVSVDRVYLMLVRARAAAQYALVQDNTELVDRSVKDLIVFPISQS